MKVLFLGGKAVGYGILKELLKTDEVIAVFTNSSDLEEPRWYPQIKELIWNKTIPYYTLSVNSIGKIFKADYIICTYYDEILTKETINLASKGAINIHLGLIQEYRGCYPTTFPIIDKKDHAGITIHKLTEDIDNGEVYKQQIVSISKHDTGKSVYDKCTISAINCFKKVWQNIKMGISKPQTVNTNNAHYYTRKDFPSLEIDHKWRSDRIDRYVRALTFPPFPRPYFMIGGKKFEIHYD